MVLVSNQWPTRDITSPLGFDASQLSRSNPSSRLRKTTIHQSGITYKMHCLGRLIYNYCCQIFNHLWLLFRAQCLVVISLYGQLVVGVLLCCDSRVVLSVWNKHGWLFYANPRFLLQFLQCYHHISLMMNHCPMISIGNYMANGFTQPRWNQ